MIRTHRPDVIVDCINTATALSYQEVEPLSLKTHEALQQLQQTPDDPSVRETLTPMSRRCSFRRRRFSSSGTFAFCIGPCARWARVFM